MANMDSQQALQLVSEALQDSRRLVKAVASGVRRGCESLWVRVEVRYVDLKSGRKLQIVYFDQRQSHTKNYSDYTQAVQELTQIPFNNWHLTLTDQVMQLRFTKKGAAQLHVAAHEAQQEMTHDRAKQYLLPMDHPVFAALGLADSKGHIKPSRRDKFRQVQEFCAQLVAAVDAGLAAGVLPSNRRVEIADLGCGNAYLTFAADAVLAAKGVSAHLVGVDIKEQSRRHNMEVADRLGVGERLSFVVSDIASAGFEQTPDVVLALHACDTATDDALAAAVKWNAKVILAAPCCHHDIARQLKQVEPPAEYQILVRDGILRERFADTLTDSLRAQLLRLRGYRVEVFDFIDSAHTPRNTMLRAVYTGNKVSEKQCDRYQKLIQAWGIVPALEARLNS